MEESFNRITTTIASETHSLLTRLKKSQISWVGWLFSSKGARAMMMFSWAALEMDSVLCCWNRKAEWYPCKSTNHNKMQLCFYILNVLCLHCVPVSLSLALGLYIPKKCIHVHWSALLHWAVCVLGGAKIHNIHCVNGIFLSQLPNSKQLPSLPAHTCLCASASAHTHTHTHKCAHTHTRTRWT